MLFAIGAGHQVVAVDEDSDYPKDAPRTSLSGLEPNVEAIAKYRPQLVVISYNPSNFEKTMERLGVKVLLQDAPSNLAGAYAQIEQLGRVTGRVTAADALDARMQRQIHAALRSAPHFSKAPTFFYELDQGGYSVTSTTFVGKLLTMFGLHDIADAAKGSSDGYPDLSTEYIVKSNPNLIFLADTICCHQSLSTVAKRPGYGALTAVKDGDVFGLNDDIASRSGTTRRRARAGHREGPVAVRAPASELMTAVVTETRGSTRRAFRRDLAFYVGAIVFVLGAATLAILIGPADLSPATVFEVLAGKLLVGVHPHISALDTGIVWQLRAPRVVLAALVGATLAIAGASYQGVFQNPLADPYLLGVAAGAGLGATLAVAVVHDSSSWAIDPIPLAAFAGAIVSVGLTYVLGRSGQRLRTTTSLILAGVAVGSFLTAIQTYEQQRNTKTLLEVYSWILGGLGGADWQEVLLVLPYVVVCVIVLLASRRLLDVMAVGDEEADSLGVRATHASGASSSWRRRSQPPPSSR